MAIKKQLKDKDGNTIYPDVGLNLDDVVYSDDPEPTTTPDPWIESGDITDDAVTDDKIDWDGMEHGWRKVYDVTITAASGTVNYDVPIDLENNRRIAIYMSYEPSSGSIQWSYAQALNGSKSVIDCFQTGVECGGGISTGVFQNRELDQIIAWGVEGYASAHAEIFLKRAESGNWVTFTANGFGGNNVDTRRSQMFQGRIKSGAPTTKYIRFRIINPQAGGSIVVMALK